MLEQEENKIEREEAGHLNERLSEIQHSLEGLKEDETLVDNIFLIVVESLRSKGHNLPNEKIISIKKLYTAQNEEAVIVTFKDGVSILFGQSGATVTVKIKHELYSITGDESSEYREKYYAYALLFITELATLKIEDSKLAKARLDKIGI